MNRLAATALLTCVSLAWGIGGLWAHSGVLDEDGGHIDPKTGEYHTHVKVQRKAPGPPKPDRKEKPGPDRPGPDVKPKPEQPDIDPALQALYDSSMMYWEARLTGRWGLAYIYEEAQNELTLEQYTRRATKDPFAAAFGDGTLGWKVAEKGARRCLLQIDFYSPDGKHVGTVKEHWKKVGDKWLHEPDAMVTKAVEGK